MPLVAADFTLSEAALAALNRYVSERASAGVAAGEDAPGGLEVSFAFVPGLGRVVTARFDGHVAGCELPD